MRAPHERLPAPARRKILNKVREMGREDVTSKRGKDVLLNDN
jgi:hypothetical protein